jgi:Holliday junction DNA helicase RuvA
MIAFLNGTLEFIGPEYCIIDVNGVGYKVYLPASTRDQVGRVGDRVRLYTHMNVREDVMELYGFKTGEELDFFRTLITVSGIGPKVGLKILSSISVEDFKAAILSENMANLTKIPGIGKKTAQRLIFELKDKLGTTILPETQDTPAIIGKGTVADACEALMSLGYSHDETVAALNFLRGELGDGLEELETSELLRRMLKSFQLER